jgi:hypothetical protein
MGSSPGGVGPKTDKTDNFLFYAKYKMYKQQILIGLESG